MQVQGDVADRVREIEPDLAAVPVRERTYRRHIEGLSRVVLHARQQQQFDLVALAFQQAGEVVQVQEPVVTRTPLQQVASRVVAM